MPDLDEITETLVEMAFRWGDVERALPGWTRKDPLDSENRLPIGARVRDAVDHAFRVEAFVESEVDDFGNERNAYRYVLLFDVEDEQAREGSAIVRQERALIEK